MKSCICIIYHIACMHAARGSCPVYMLHLYGAVIDVQRWYHRVAENDDTELFEALQRQAVLLWVQEISERRQRRYTDSQRFGTANTWHDLGSCPSRPEFRNIF